MSGGEFGSSYPGDYGFDYVYPTHDHTQHFIDQGMTVFRIPFRWARIQYDLYGELQQEELDRLIDLTSFITDQGGYAILDVHDYAHRGGNIVGSEELPNDTLADLWSRLSVEFADDDHVWFGLMNEPYGISAEQWLSAANDSIAAIREAGASNAILVPGVRWTGAHSWYAGDEGSNAAVMGGVVDPANNLVFELHQYLDSDSSGTNHEQCMSETIGSERLAGVTGWLRDNGYRGLLGEFAGADNETCEAAIIDMLQYMQDNQDAWLGFTWWATGMWWGDYPFSIAPDGDTPAPQTEWLIPYL
ncbi:glycoside hydrolase family 5 protein [Pseudenhygromyxa sp. WMMC2535]|nr:glycoside hydrolase family 5 protein [Pseudenhygromyxa sp. WMMC2535]NVB39536.1 glycoside hydrolase family 5 protein [Pseudenhygromyxa sp. WMMC2535]